MSAPNKSRLGRGLDALLTIENPTTSGSSSINEIDLSKIEPNPDQPRSVFEDEALEELANSVRTHGIIQPITLKEVTTDQYMIIAGERRYRAAGMAGLTKIPAYIKTAADEDVAEIALIENIQREDLNAMEIALAYQKLIDDNGFTQDKLSERVGKKRTTVANYLRLLKLPAEIQLGLKGKKIDMGHARALISVNDPEIQLAVYEQILKDGLSVRNVEEIVRNVSTDPNLPPVANNDGTNDGDVRKKSLPEEYQELKQHLAGLFKTKVNLTFDERQKKGKITIPFNGEHELEDIIALLDKMK